MVKETTETKEEVLTYEQFEEKVMKEYPSPFFCYGGDEEMAEQYKKNHPDACIYTGTPFGTALCIDAKVRLMLKYEIYGALQAHTYMSSKFFAGALNLNTDCIRVLEEIEKGGD